MELCFDRAMSLPYCAPIGIPVHLMVAALFTGRKCAYRRLEIEPIMTLLIQPGEPFTAADHDPACIVIEHIADDFGCCLIFGSRHSDFGFTSYPKDLQLCFQ